MCILSNACSASNGMCTGRRTRGTKLDMRFRVGLLAGLAVGYYLGTKAGRERYEQLRALVARTPLSKVQAAYELGLERIRDRAPHAGEAVVPPSPN